MSVITYGDTGVTDLFGVPISVGDEMVMWRPNGLDRCIITKYNPSTSMMGVQVTFKVRNGWDIKENFSTPFYTSKFYSIRGNA